MCSTFSRPVQALAKAEDAIKWGPLLLVLREHEQLMHEALWERPTWRLDYEHAPSAARKSVHPTRRHRKFVRTSPLAGDRFRDQPRS